MKKSIVLLFATLLLFSVVGCNKNEVRAPKSEVELLVGYMVIEGDTLHFHEVDISGIK